MGIWQGRKDTGQGAHPLQMLGRRGTTTITSPIYRRLFSLVRTVRRGWIVDCCCRLITCTSRSGTVDNSKSPTLPSPLEILAGEKGRERPKSKDASTVSTETYPQLLSPFFLSLSPSFTSTISSHLLPLHFLRQLNASCRTPEFLSYDASSVLLGSRVTRGRK